MFLTCFLFLYVAERASEVNRELIIAYAMFRIRKEQPADSSWYAAFMQVSSSQNSHHAKNKHFLCVSPKQPYRTKRTEINQTSTWHNKIRNNTKRFWFSPKMEENSRALSSIRPDCLDKGEKLFLWHMCVKSGSLFFWLFYS